MSDHSSKSTASLTQSKVPCHWSNGLEVSKYYGRFLVVQKCYCLALAAQCAMTVLYYELDYKQSDFTQVVLYCLLVGAIASCLLNVCAFFCYNDWRNFQGMQYQGRSFWELSLELAVILAQPYPFLQQIYIGNKNYVLDQVIPYKLNYLLVLIACSKALLLTASLINLVKFKSPRISRLCKIYGCENSNFYLIKYYFKQQPVAMVSILFLMSLLLFSFAYRVSQRSLITQQNTFEYYSNALWMVTVTISSVGFGDYAPVTSIGRIVGFFCTFCGVLTVSVLVLVVVNTFEMGYAENKALVMQKKLNARAEIKALAGQYIREALWRLWKNKKDKAKAIQTEPDSEKTKRRNLRRKIRELKSLRLATSNFNLQMNTQFDKVSANLQNLNSNCDQILRYLSNNYFLNLDEIKNQSDYNFVELR